MERQVSFSEIEFQSKRKRTQKERFFEKMERIVPLRSWCELIRPYYYKIGDGRRPMPLEQMLKMYLVSHWFNLSDPACEDMLNENLAARAFVGIKGDAPDETTLCKFRHLMEKHNLNEVIFEHFNKQLEEEKIILRKGTIVDATIIEAPTSRKNKTKQRTPEMGSTVKNEQNHYGMKAHIGLDKDSGIIHSVVSTPANKSDIAMAGDILHGEEEEVYGDAGYIGIERRVEVCEKLQDGTGETEWLKHSKKKRRYLVCKKRKNVNFEINRKRSAVETEEHRADEKRKSSIRVKVEHVFAVIKHRFNFRRTRYRNLSKNHNKVLMLCTLANLLTYARRKLSTISG